MTNLEIIPNIESKTLKLSGRVAAGEKVSVRLRHGSDLASDGLRLRVMHGMQVVGVFPVEQTEGECAWTNLVDEDNSLACELNLNTAQAERSCRFGAEVLWILEDPSVPQLYGTAEGTLEPWVKVPVEDVPIDLNDYVTDIRQIKKDAAKAKADVAAHLTDSDNPHKVTKGQVGLGNVDNTSDAQKPVSVAQKVAIEESANQVKSLVFAEEKRAITIETENRQMIMLEGQERKMDIASVLAEAKSYTDTKTGGVYKVMGEATPAEINLMTSQLIGYVYNMTEAGDIVRGESRDGVIHVEPGDNVVWTQDGYWDKLGAVVDLSGKTDKVAGATSGNFAALDAAGNLKDSGKKPTDFAPYGHKHEISDVTGLDDKLTNFVDKTELDTIKDDIENLSGRGYLEKREGAIYAVFPE